MRVTRHPYEVEGWGVGELWVGDGASSSPRPADARRPLHGVSPTPARTTPNGPQGHPGCPY